MNEINNRNNELSDAALESVSGGSSEIVQETCASCPSRKNSSSYSCTYEGGDPEKLRATLSHYRVIGNPQSNSYYSCPYLKRL